MRTTTLHGLTFDYTGGEVLEMYFNGRPCGQVCEEYIDYAVQTTCRQVGDVVVLFYTRESCEEDGIYATYYRNSLGLQTWTEWDNREWDNFYHSLYLEDEMVRYPTVQARSHERSHDVILSNTKFVLSDTRAGFGHNTYRRFCKRQSRRSQRRVGKMLTQLEV